VKVELITLLLGFGSPAVDSDQVRVWVPGVACHSVCAVTVNGVSVGPGYESEPLPQDAPSITHSASTLCGKDPEDEIAAITMPNVTG